LGRESAFNIRLRLMNLTRRSLLKSIASAPLVQGAAQKKPNVLVIVCDEWRAQATSYNGDPNVRTPVLDRFAGESVNFENAVSGCPVCCPARASMMTGQYPLTNGVFINDVELKPNSATLAELFAKSGYHTGYIGKWHLYGSPDGNYGRRLAYIPQDHRLGFQYWKACECSHDYNHSLYYSGEDPTPRYWPGYDADSQTEDACHFIEEQAKAQDPFLLFLSLGPPHFPYETAPGKYREIYTNLPIRLRPNVPSSQSEQAKKILRGYYAHMAALDNCLERLLATLARNGIADDTIVVFTSDHGDMMLSQGLTTKLYPWDESIRIPFLIRYPRKWRTQGHVVHTPVSLLDLMPTLLALSGQTIPDAVQGVDRSGLHEDPNGAALINLPVPITEARRYGFAEYRGLRTRTHTYVRSIQGPWLLYDNTADPFQKHNLCNNTEFVKVQRELDRQLSGVLRGVKDDFLPSTQYVRRAGLSHYKEVNVPAGHTRSPWGDWVSTIAAS